MKRSLFLKYINAAILFGLVAPTAQLFSATNQNGLRKRAVGYVRSAGVDFGKGISSGAQRAYRGTAAGAKRVGAVLTMGREKAITRAKKEQEHVMEGAQAALKRMKGKSLSKKEQDHLYSFEKRAGALLALLAILAGTTWILTRKTDDGDVPPPPPPFEWSILGPGKEPLPAPVPAPPAPPLGASRLGAPLSMSRIGEAPLPGPPVPPSDAPDVPLAIPAPVTGEKVSELRESALGRDLPPVLRPLPPTPVRREEEAREELEQLVAPDEPLPPLPISVTREALVPAPLYPSAPSEDELRRKAEAEIKAEMQKLQTERKAGKVGIPLAPPPPPAAPGQVPDEPTLLQQLAAPHSLRKADPVARPEPAKEGGLIGTVAADPRARAMLEAQQRRDEEE